jgi:hypothetical protein
VGVTDEAEALKAQKCKYHIAPLIQMKEKVIKLIKLKREKIYFVLSQNKEYNTAVKSL